MAARKATDDKNKRMNSPKQIRSSNETVTRAMALGDREFETVTL